MSNPVSFKDVAYLLGPCGGVTDEMDPLTIERRNCVTTTRTEHMVVDLVKGGEVCTAVTSHTARFEDGVHDLGSSVMHFGTKYWPDHPTMPGHGEDESQDFFEQWEPAPHDTVATQCYLDDLVHNVNVVVPSNLDLSHREALNHTLYEVACFTHVGGGTVRLPLIYSYETRHYLDDEV